MTTGTFEYRLGDTTVTVLDSGLLVFEMATELGLTAADWGPRYAEYFAQPLHVPMQHVLVQTPETTLLVDAGSYDMPDDSPMRVPGYTPPPSIPAQLQSRGVAPASIDHILITHLHLDHYNGLTETHDGTVQLCFPKATVYVGASDWVGPHGLAAREQPDSVEYATLGEVARRNQLATVTGRLRLATGVEILPMPGETPGHLGLRVASGDAVLYVIGDLVHHIVEAAEPEWHVSWADHATIVASRYAVLDQAAQEGALVVASHIAGAGRVRKTAAGWAWSAV